MRLSGYTWPVPGMARKLSGPLNCILHVTNYLKAMQQTHAVLGHYGSVILLLLHKQVHCIGLEILQSDQHT